MVLRREEGLYLKLHTAAFHNSHNSNTLLGKNNVKDSIHARRVSLY
jgi:hypothetical protein